MLKGHKGNIGFAELWSCVWEEVCQSLRSLVSLSSQPADLLCKMSQTKMLQFSTGALLLLLPWFGGLVLGEISDNFSQCLNFFYNETPPSGIPAAGYQPICQRYKNQYHFASLYHRQHRAPLYSAYILSPADGKRPNNTWKYEPQVSVVQQQRFSLQTGRCFSFFLFLPPLHLHLTPLCITAPQGGDVIVS